MMFLNVCLVFVASFVEVSNVVNNKDRGPNTPTLLAIQEPQAGSSSAQMFEPQTSLSTELVSPVRIRSPPKVGQKKKSATSLSKSNLLLFVVYSIVSFIIIALKC